MLCKVKYDLLNRKDTESLYLQRAIDKKKAQKNNVLKF